MNHITIEVVTGGFVLTNAKPTEVTNASTVSYDREVFVSQTKLIKKLKDLLDAANPKVETKE